jgi:hypothetical protein
LIAWFLLLGAVAFNLYYLFPEVAIRVPALNDDVLHLLTLQQTVAALAAGKDPTDFWLGQIGFGYPLFHYYQHLPDVAPAVLYALLSRVIRSMPPLDLVLSWISYLLLSLFPLSIYWSMRRFGFDRLPSAFAGLAASLISANFIYGLDFGSYVWAGSGLYTQLWAMVLLPPTLAQGYVALRTGRGFFWAVVLLAATLLCHLVYGYIALGSLVLIAALVDGPNPLAPFPAREGGTPERGSGVGAPLPAAGRGRGLGRYLDAPLSLTLRNLGRRGARLVLLFALVALVISYFLVPFFLDHAYMNRSVWERPEKYDSFGAAQVLGWLVKGQLFDYGRFPSLTLLAGVGVLVCVWRWRQERYRIPLGLAALWLVLYFGRPAWGSLLDLLPLSRDLQFHRLIGGVHLAGIFLIGIGLGALWEWLSSGPLWERLSSVFISLWKGAPTNPLSPRERRPARLLSILLTLALTALVLFPAYKERAAYLTKNAALMALSRNAYAAEAKDLDGLAATLRNLPPGRVYAGLGANWGKDYRVGDIPVYALLQRSGFDMLGYIYHALSLNTDEEVLFDENNPVEYNLFDVRYVVAPIGRPVPSFLQPVKDFGRHRLYSVPTTGYFDLVGSDVTLVGDPRDLYPVASRWLASGLPTAKENWGVRFEGATLDYQQSFPLAKAGALIPPTAPLGGPPRGRIVSEKVQGDTYLANVVVDRPSTLLLKVTYHPNWHAYVDGVETATTMVLPSFVGVSLAPGTHNVRLVYQPGPLRGDLMLLGLLTLILLGAVEWWRGRPHRGTLRVPLPGGEGVGQPTESSLNAHALASGTPVVNLTGDVIEAETNGSAGNVIASAPETATANGAVARAKPLPVASLRMKLGIYLLFLSVYLASSAGHFISNDHVAVYLTTQSLVERHDLAIQPILDTVRGLDGRYYARYQLGQSLLSIPLYVAGTAVERLRSPAVSKYFTGPNSGLGYWGSVPIFFVSLFDQLVTPLTCLLVFLFCLRLGFSSTTSFLTTLIFGLATSTWVYSREYSQHPLESLTLLLSVYILFSRRERLTARDACLAGIAFGLSVLTRINVLVMAPMVTLYLLWIVPATGVTDAKPGSAFDRASDRWIARIRWESLRRTSAREVVDGPGRYLLAFALPVVVALLSIFYVNDLRFGSPLEFGPNAYDQGFSTPLWLGLYGYLFSAGRSILLYSPPILLGVFGFGHFYRRHRAEALLFLGITAGYLVVYSTFGYWAGGWSYGPRYLLPIVPFLTIPAAYVLGTGRRRILVALLTALGIVVQILGVAVNYSDVYSEWVAAKLSPWDAFLFIPDISAIPTHLRALAAGRHVDLRLLWVYQQFGLGVFLATLSLPLVALASSAALLKSAFSRTGSGEIRPGLANQLGPSLAPPIERLLPIGVAPRIGVRTKLGIYLLFLSVYLASGPGHFISSDHVAVYQTAQSLVERHNLAIKPINDTIRGSDGRYYDVFGIGQSIAVIPLYLIGKLVDGVASPAVRAYFSGVNLGDWGGTVPIFFVSLFNQFVTPLTCILVFLFCLRLGFPLTTSLVTMLIFGFSTAAWVYARDSFQHPLEALLLLLAVYLPFANRGSLRPSHAFLAGLAVALATLVRVNVLLTAPVILGYIVYLCWRENAREHGDQGTPARESNGAPQIRELMSRGLNTALSRDGRWYLLAFIAPIVLALGVTLWIDELKFGSFLALHPSGACPGLTGSIAEGLYGNLFSVGRSIFLYSPPVVLGVLYFRKFLAAHRAEAITFLSIAGIYLVVYSSYSCWDGGLAWGPRFLVPILPFLVIPGAYALRGRIEGALLVLVALVGSGVQVLGIAVNYSYVYWDWVNLKLVPGDAFLWVPAVSAIPTHLQDLLQGRNVDLWLVWVYHHFSAFTFLATLLVPVSVLAASLVLLRDVIGAAWPPGPLKVASVVGSAAVGFTDEATLGALPEGPHRGTLRVPLPRGEGIRGEPRLLLRRISVGAARVGQLPYLAGVAVAAVFAGLPLFQFKLMSGHDTLEYITRNNEFYRGLTAGQLLPRWSADLSAGYGEPYFNFNPPVAYYLPALFHALGVSFVAAENLAIFAVLLVAGLGMYLLASEFFGRRGGLVSAVAYIFAPYFLVTLYVRHSLSDFSAYAFIPLALWGLYRFADGGGYRFLLIGAFSVALLLLGSNPVALITFPAFALLLVWLAWTGRSWRTLWRGAWCLALGLGLSAFFWLPAMAERGMVHISRLLEGPFNYHNHFVFLDQLIYSPWGYGVSVPGRGDGMSFAIGPVHLAAAAAGLLLIWRIRHASRRGQLMVLFSLIVLLYAALLSSDVSGFIWDRLPLLQYLGYPWRFHSLIAVSTALLCGFPFLLVPAGQRWLSNGLLGGLLVVLLVVNYPHARPEKFLSVQEADYSPSSIATRQLAVTTLLEYEPIWVQQRPLTPAPGPVSFLAGQGRVAVISASPTDSRFQIEVAKQARLRINTFYFPGWTLYVDGAERPTDYSNPQGLMDFSLEPGRHLVRVTLLDTPVRRWSDWLSLLALVVLAGAGFLWRRGSKGRPDFAHREAGNRMASLFGRLTRFAGGGGGGMAANTPPAKASTPGGRDEQVRPAEVGPPRARPDRSMSLTVARVAGGLYDFLPRRGPLGDSAIVVVLALLLYGRALLPGLVLMPADLIAAYPPWSSLPASAGIHPQNPILADVINFQYPWHRLAWEQIHAGRLPLWDPYISFGAPLFANQPGSWLFPLTLLSFLLPLNFGFTVMTLLKPVLLGIGVAVYAAHQGLRPPSSTVAVIALTFSGFLVSWLQYPVATVAVMLPWLLLAADALVEAPSPRRIAALALVVALQFFGGAGETSIHALAFLAIYVVYRSFSQAGRERFRAIGRIITCGAAVALGTALAAIQLLPALGLLGTSWEVAARQAEIPGSRVIPWAGLINWLVPNFYGNPSDGQYWGPINFSETAGYVGVATLVLATLAWGSRARRSDAAFFAATIAGVLAIAYPTPLNRVAGLMPFLGVANNNRLVFVGGFCVAMLAALGVESLQKGVDRLDRRRLIAPAAVVLLLAGLGVVTAGLAGIFGSPGATLARSLAMVPLPPNAGWGDFLVRWTVFGFILAIAAFAVVVALLWQPGRLRPLAWALPVLVAGELLLIGGHYNPVVSSDLLYPPTPLSRWLATLDPSRVVLFQGLIFLPNTPTIAHVRDPRAYDPYTDLRHQRWFGALDPSSVDRQKNPYFFVPQDPDPRIAALAGVDYFVTPANVDPRQLPRARDQAWRYRSVWTDGSFTAWEIAGARPRFYFASAARVVANESAALAALKLELTPERNDVVVEGPIGAGARLPAGAGRVTVVRDQAGEIALATEDSAPGLLVVGESFNPGWQASVDGGDRPILRANDLFMAVELPAGAHRVLLRYEPATGRVGLAVSAVALAILAGLMVPLRKYWRRLGVNR